MPQTLLAILSMVLTTMFAVNQHRSALSTQMGIIRQDLSLQSTGVATDLLDEISAMAFDEATKTEAVVDPSLLTTLPIFDLHETDWEQEYVFQESAGADDLDDFNGLSIVRSRVNGEHTLSFSLQPRVTYVADDGETEVTYVTKYKKVMLEVVSSDFVFADTVRVSQVFACGSRCDW